ncbi:MAG: nitronate monooxygenase, partial [Bacteroidetes bacterium]|nr:nitronate monooxygenase [Bacteroidota bacterium]
SGEGRTALIHVIEEVSEEIFMPFCVGGGINDIEDIRILLRSGADKVSICTAAVKNPDFIKEASEIFGAQCIVVCVDFREEDGKRIVYTSRGQEPTEWEVVDYVKHIMAYNPGEILLNSISRDGMMIGYDIELIKQVTALVDVPVIAMGGVGTLEHLQEGIRAGASAVAAASIFHFTDQSPIKANFFLKTAGIEIR